MILQITDSHITATSHWIHFVFGSGWGLGSVDNALTVHITGQVTI